MKSFIITLSKISTSLSTALNLKQQLESYGMAAELFEGTYGNDAVEQMAVENRTIHPVGIKGPVAEDAEPDQKKLQKISSPGVKESSPSGERARRKGSFLTRFYTNPSGPLVDDDGDPTRLALAANAWGEPVPRTAGAAYVAINKLTDATDKGAKSTQAYNSHLSELNEFAKQFAAANEKNRKVVVKTTTDTTKLTAAEKKAAEVRAAIKKAGLDKFGIKNVSDTDPIQLEAARLNLLKQNNLEEQRKIAAIIENMNAQMKANQAVERYVDFSD